MSQATTEASTAPKQSQRGKCVSKVFARSKADPTPHPLPLLILRFVYSGCSQNPAKLQRLEFSEGEFCSSSGDQESQAKGKR